ncbi:MAG: RNA-binding domain-containing protein [Sulfolobales archaeon]
MSAQENLEIIGVEISCIAHATEDYDKVLQAILNTSSPGLRDLLRKNISYEDTLGHYKDPIRIYRAKLEREYAYEYLSHILTRLSRSEFEIVLLSLEERYDPRENKVYLRISKQDAYRNSISLAFDDDMIRVVTTLRGPRSVPLVERFIRSLRKEEM